MLCSILLMQGCDTPSFTSNYSFVTSNDGNGYRLNNYTGEVTMLHNNQLVAVHKSNIILISPDTILETENSTFYRYKGEGNFEKYDSEIEVNKMIEGLINKLE